MQRMFLLMSVLALFAAATPACKCAKDQEAAEAPAEEQVEVVPSEEGDDEAPAEEGEAEDEEGEEAGE